MDSDDASLSPDDDVPERPQQRQVRRRGRPTAGGLRTNERVTAGRLENPGKYTDKSLWYERRPTRLRQRARASTDNADIGIGGQIKGVCTNILGRIRPCRDLVTDHNFRTTFVSRDVLPVNMLLALLLDTDTESIKVYGARSVLRYYSSVVTRTRNAIDGLDLNGDQLPDTEEQEYVNMNLLVRFANNLSQVVSNMALSTGVIDPIDILTRKYAPYAEIPLNTFRQLLVVSVSPVDANDPGLNEITLMERTIDTLKAAKATDVRLWGVDTELAEPSQVVEMRRNQKRINRLTVARQELTNTLRNLEQNDQVMAANDNGSDSD